MKWERRGVKNKKTRYFLSLARPQAESMTKEKRARTYFGKLSTNWERTACQILGKRLSKISYKTQIFRGKNIKKIYVGIYIV